MNGATANLHFEKKVTLIGGWRAATHVGENNTVNITGSTDTFVIQGGITAAGIGGNCDETAGNITMMSGNFEITQGSSTSGNQGGRSGGGGVNGGAGNIFIGGTTKIIAGNPGFLPAALIGLGSFNENDITKNSNIRITDEAVIEGQALSDSYCALIGGSCKTNGGDISIDGNSQIIGSMEGSQTAAVIGGGNSVKYGPPTNIRIGGNAFVEVAGGSQTSGIGTGYGSNSTANIEFFGSPTVLSYTYEKSVNIEGGAVKGNINKSSCESSEIRVFTDMKSIHTLIQEEAVLNINANGIKHSIQLGINITSAPRYYLDVFLLSPRNEFELTNFEDNKFSSDIVKSTNAVKVNFYDENKSLLTEYYAEKGKRITQFDYAPAGKVISGWYSDSTLTNKWDFATVITDNLDLYANPIDQYKVTYELNGGEVVEGSNPDNYTVETSDWELTNPTKMGYNFTGWTYLGHSNPSTTVTIDKGTTGDLAFVAHWEKNKYEAQFNGNGGLDGESIKQDYDEPLGELPTSVRSGYNFLGWYTSAEGEVALKEKAVIYD